MSGPRDGTIRTASGLSVIVARTEEACKISPCVLTLAGRPQLVKGNSQPLFGGMGRLSENSVLVMKNKSFSITAEVESASLL